MIDNLIIDAIKHYNNKKGTFYQKPTINAIRHYICTIKGADSHDYLSSINLRNELARMNREGKISYVEAFETVWFDLDPFI